MSIEDRQRLLQPFIEQFETLAFENKSNKTELIDAIGAFAALKHPTTNDFERFEAACLVANEALPSLNATFIEMFHKLLEDSECKALMIHAPSDEILYIRSDFIRNDVINQLNTENNTLIQTLHQTMKTNDWVEVDALALAQLELTMPGIIRNFDTPDANFRDLTSTLKKRYAVFLDDVKPTLSTKAYITAVSCVRAIYSVFDSLDTWLSTGAWETSSAYSETTTLFKQQYKNEIYKTSIDAHFDNSDDEDDDVFTRNKIG